MQSGKFRRKTCAENLFDEEKCDVLYKMSLFGNIFAIAVTTLIESNFAYVLYLWWQAALNWEEPEDQKDIVHHALDISTEVDWFDTYK